MTDPPLTQRDVEALRTTLDKLDRTIDGLRQEMASTYVRKDVLDPVLATLNQKVDGHSEAFTWIVRIVVGAVVLALLGLVIVQGGAR